MSGSDMDIRSRAWSCATLEQGVAMCAKMAGVELDARSARDAVKAFCQQIKHDNHTMIYYILRLLHLHGSFVGIPLQQTFVLIASQAAQTVITKLKSTESPPSLVTQLHTIYLESCSASMYIDSTI